MLSKWSSKSPRQKAVQIRNNQRRHRAKVKARISTLETELAESQRRLIAAERRITALTAEVNHLREPDATMVSSMVSSFNPLTSHTVPESSYSYITSSQRELGNFLYSKQLNLSLERPVIADSSVKDNNNALLGTIIGVDIEANDQTLAAAFVAQYDRQTLPPPQPGESTTTCIAAYGIIAQQNFKMIDMEDIHQWLKSAYRRATRPGDGCTVVNTHVYNLINYLSPI